MKKFSINNINQFDILKHAIIGFEFEFFAEKSYYKLLEYLNREYEGIKTKGYRKYHSKFDPTDKIFKIEPDYSLGPRGVEMITGPLQYVNARILLLKTLKIIQDFGRTNEKCSIHINISFDDEVDKPVELLNVLKLILDIDENYIYKKFPIRENNFYAKSVKKLIPFKGYDFANDAIRQLTNNLELPDTKYYGINTNVITEGRIEFRYIGGTNYEDKTAEILDLLDFFIINSYNSINIGLSEDNIVDLREYLNENINNFKKYKQLNDFIAEFPTIKLQVDKNTSPIIVETYYPSFYNNLFDLINNIYNLQDCIINWNTDSKKLELVDAEFKAIFDIKNVDIIECIIDGGSFYKCNLINCELKNNHIYSTHVINSTVNNSKIESSKVDATSEVNNCYLFNSMMDGMMNGGVFRSGKIGENAIIGDDVEIVSGIDSYFGVKQTDIEKRSKKKTDKKEWFKD